MVKIVSATLTSGIPLLTDSERCIHNVEGYYRDSETGNLVGILAVDQLGTKKMIPLTSVLFLVHGEEASIPEEKEVSPKEKGIVEIKKHIKTTKKGKK